MGSVTDVLVKNLSAWDEYWGQSWYQVTISQKSYTPEHFPPPRWTFVKICVAFPKASLTPIELKVIYIFILFRPLPLQCLYLINEN